MLTADEAVKDVALIQPYINQQLAARVIAELGYQWPDERIERVASAMPKFFAVSGDMPWSLSEAIHEELYMYGDGSISDPVGILSLSH